MVWWCMKGKEELIQAWLSRAISSLEKASTASSNPKVCFEDLCFDCQQAVEKALKALLLSLDVPFPKTHSLNLLIDLLSDRGVIIPDSIEVIEEMSNYAVATRYPGEYEPVTKEEFNKALRLTDSILKWVERKINHEELF